MKNNRTRSSLFGIAGGYLLYLAWQLFQERGAPDTTMPQGVSILFVMLFALAGAGLMGYALRLWQRASDEDDKDEHDDNALK